MFGKSFDVLRFCMRNSGMKRLLALFVVVLTFSGCREKSTEFEPAEILPELPADGVDTDFVGLSLEDAEALVEKRGLSYRIVAKGGKLFPATTDYRADRLSFSFEKNLITKVTRG